MKSASRRYAILGNSGSGKSRLAGELARAQGLPVLDLDTIAWEPGLVAVRRPSAAALSDLDAFIAGARGGWIVEGCYGELVERALAHDPVLLFLNPGADVCRARCLGRPHEPHKFATKEEQDRALPFLLRWIDDYYARADDMSLTRHAAIFAAYRGEKRELTEPVRDLRALREETRREIWFPAKTHGWGWGPPVCWQGWAVIAAYLLALALGALVILRDPRRAPVLVAYAIVLSGALCLVSWWKGEKPGWRWGETTDETTKRREAGPPDAR